MKRREFVQAGISIPFFSSTINYFENSSFKSNNKLSTKHSICQWCYGSTPLEELCDKAKDLRIESIELLHPEQWDTVIKRGMTCAVGYANNWGLTRGFNDLSNHAELLTQYSKVIPLAAERGIPQIISFSGNSNGLSSEKGLEHCAVGLDPIVKIAEKYNIVITMELLNSKIDHRDYQCDNTRWGVDLVEKLGSSHFKLLYDIYHMQIMEGDVIRTIKDNKDYISHFHTGGVPGRNEIDETQELNYSAIVKAIQSENFNGYIAQEFIPTSNKPFESLAKAIQICSV